MEHKLYYIKDESYHLCMFNDETFSIKYNVNEQYRDLSVGDIPKLKKILNESIIYFQSLINAQEKTRDGLLKNLKYHGEIKRIDAIFEIINKVKIDVSYKDIDEIYRKAFEDGKFHQINRHKAFNFKEALDDIYSKYEDQIINPIKRFKENLHKCKTNH